MSRAFLKDILRAIRKSKSRFISIILIVALGTGFFVGMKVTGPSMSSTAEKYYISNNLMDIRVQSTIGLTDDDVTQIKNVENVEGVMGQKFIDALVLVNGNPEIDIDGSQISTRAYGIDLNQLQKYYYGADDPSFINRPILLEGTYPTKSNQCLVDASKLSTPETYTIGSKITLEGDTNTDLSGLNTTEFEIVGIIESPYYLSFERGNCLVGSGKIGTYIYIPNSAFTNDYYSEIYVKVKGASDYSTYSDEYYNYVEKTSEAIKNVADSCVDARVSTLKSTLPEQITSGEKSYNSAKSTLDEKLKDAEEQIALYQKYVDDPDGSYSEAVNAAASALGIASDEFNGNSDAYYNAVETYNSNLAAYKNARTLQEQKYNEWLTKKDVRDKAESAVNTAQTTLNTTNSLITQTNSVITSADNVMTSLENSQNAALNNDQISQVLAVLQTMNPDLYNSVNALSAVTMAQQAMATIQPYLEQEKSLLAQYQSQLATQQVTLNNYQQQLSAAKTALDIAKNEYDASDAQLDAAEEALNAFYDQLEGTKSTLSMAQIQLMMQNSSATNDLNLLKATIANADDYLAKAKKAYNEQKASADSKLAEAENKIKTAKNLLTKLDSASWSIYDRQDIPGYTSYQDAVDNVDVLSNIFPIIFFLVAALVSLTTMTRMVEEERTQLGTLKALGYSNLTIESKYIIYALLASIIGGAFGIIIGIYALPFAIFKAYSIMFTMPALTYSLPARYMLIGLGTSVITTILASVIACTKELYVHPSTLMRPKAPKPGKRVLLEKIGFIWKRLTFTGKVTIRNLFRKKVRFVMTILGIGGCTALILASIGMYTSINSIMKRQYASGGIAGYDYQLVFSEGQKDDSALMQLVKSDTRIQSIMLTSMQSVTGGSESSDKTADVYLFVPKNTSEINSYVKLQNRQTGAALSLNDTGAIITEKFANDMNVSVGDSVWVKIDENSDNKVSIPVAAITENYTFNYIYITENLYQYLFQEAVNYNYAIGTVDPSILTEAKPADNTSTQKSKLATELMAYDGINAVAYISDTVDTLNEVINVLSNIIIIFIVAAALLAFTVLYNLSNINVSERQRELATIKVLGFHNKEVSAYVMRENIILTLIGIIVGLVGGVFLHKLLIVYCAVDTVMYGQNLTWYAFVIAAAVTAMFSVIVNMMMHRKMKNISMVESLKSIE